MADKTTGKLKLWLAKITDKISDTINIYLSENFSKIDDEFSSLKDGVDEHKADDASTTAKGHVQLNNTVTSTSTTQAATANAVKTVNDALTSHKADIATDTELGHVRLSDVENIVDDKINVIDSESIEIFMDGEWVLFKAHIPDDTSGSPGSSMLIAGTMQAGYFGTVPSSELISGDALASEIGLSVGTSQFSSVDWLKFAIDGKIIFTPQKPFRYNLSWNAIDAVNAVYGALTVNIGGLTYKVRLWRGAENDPSDYTDADRDAIGSEWNRLMLPIHVNAPDSFAYPDYVDSPTEDWGIDFTDEDLLTHDDYGDGAYTWCQETRGDNSANRVVRGRYGVSNSYSGTASFAASRFGWRPVLELL